MKSALLLMLVLLVVLVPIITYVFGEWLAYLGHGLLAILFSVLIVYVKTRYYWEEE